MQDILKNGDTCVPASQGIARISSHRHAATVVSAPTLKHAQQTPMVGLC